MSKMKIFLRTLLVLLLAADLLFIFFNSSSTGESSDGISAKVTEFVLYVTVPRFKTLGEEERQAMIDKAHGTIRELAHLIEFVPLGASLSALILTFEDSRLVKKMKKLKFYLSCALLTLVFGVLYATFDECHQLFVKGRGFQIFDILMDSLGVICGLTFTFFVFAVIQKRKNKSKKPARQLQLNEDK